MPGAAMPPKDALQRLLDGLQMFIREHLALARAEMKADLRALGRDLAVGAAGVPALATGYLLLMLAAGFLISLWLPQWIAFAIVASVNLGVGGILTRAGMRRAMRDRLELPRTAEEIQRDRQWLAAMRQNGGAPPGAIVTAEGVRDA
jgi:Putative Actinobacterial Holin-X, holin superfamily III